MTVPGAARFYWGARNGFQTDELKRLVEQERVETSLDVPWILTGF